MTPVDPPDHTGMHRALDRISALAGGMADHDVQLLRLGIDHAEDTIRGLMDITTQQHEELTRWDLHLAREESA